MSREQERRKDQTFRRRQGIKKVHIILDSLEGKISSTEANYKLNILPKARTDKRENISLKNVETALLDIPFIEQITRTPHDSYEDRVMFYDLLAHLKGQKFDCIGIQVKSSPKNILEFFKKINPEYPRKNNQEALCERRLIILNGQEPIPVIQEKFLNQFSTINNFYSSKSST